MTTPRRGEIWSLDNGRTVPVLSSTFYNEIASEPRSSSFPC